MTGKCANQMSKMVTTTTHAPAQNKKRRLVPVCNVLN